MGAYHEEVTLGFFKEMTEAQRGAALGLLEASLSARGPKTERDQGLALVPHPH